MNISANIGVPSVSASSLVTLLSPSRLDVTEITGGCFSTSAAFAIPA
jgi:hypothetical protein